MKVLFLDESVDHNPTVIDASYPQFVLGGVLLDQGFAEGPLETALRDFKRQLFGREDIVLHTSISTGKRNGFERPKEPRFRDRFCCPNEEGQPPLRSDQPMNAFSAPTRRISRERTGSVKKFGETPTLVAEILRGDARKPQYEVRLQQLISFPFRLSYPDRAMT